MCDYFDKKGLIATLNVDCPPLDFDIELDRSHVESHETDYENVKRLYDKLKCLPPNIAAKPDFWGWYAHAFQSEYVVYRSEVARRDYDELTVLRDFFCRSKTEPPRRMLVVNLLSRLWWTGRLMYDGGNADPYHFVKLFTQSAFNSNIVLLASSTASNNHVLFMGLLDAVEQYKEQNHLARIDRKHFVPCTKHLNSIGAVQMIDTLRRDEIKEICLAVLNKEDAQPVSADDSAGDGSADDKEIRSEG